ncbi:MAG: serine protease [Thermoleophilia bacterium]|nr:serine protease [Thermoleophilia bacterium]
MTPSLNVAATPPGASRAPVPVPIPQRPAGDGVGTDGAGSAPVPGPTGNVLIARMSVHADLTDEALMPRGPERKAAVYNSLLETAKSSQVDALAALAKLQRTGEVTAVESMFLPNAILVTTKPGSDAAVTQALRGLANVEQVTENRTWSVRSATDGSSDAAAGAAAAASHLSWASAYIAETSKEPRTAVALATPTPTPTPVPTPTPTPSPAPSPTPPTGSSPDTGLPPTGNPWGIDMIRAPEAWAQKLDGTGVTIGIVDTGLDTSHPAIQSHYRGTTADGSQQHDYNWFDPFKHQATPYDDGGHGTHVAGISAGGTEGHAVGVAPGAKLIAAKAINGQGYNTTENTLKALQWMLAPTKTDGTAADPTKGADVVNNSWGSSNPDDAFLETFAALKAAGIEVVSAAGNEGSSAGSVSAPGSYPGYFSVAASTRQDTVAGYSSRGPSKYAKNGEMVPNIAAPGSTVISTVPGGGYASKSGTSMAAPHVAGAVAILLQAQPQATHEALAHAFESTAVDIDRPGPDTAAGYGRIDIVKALVSLRGGAVDGAAPDASTGAAQLPRVTSSAPEAHAA